MTGFKKPALFCNPLPVCIKNFKKMPLINVNCIAPGFIVTKTTTRYNETELNGFLRKIPTGFLGSVDDITPMVLFLADDAKSRFIVGQTFFIDGGQSIDGAIDMMIT